MPDQPHQFSKLAEELVGDLRGVEFEEPRRSLKRPTKDLAKIVEELMVHHQIGRPSAEQGIRDQWPTLVGTANASYSHPVRIERGRLLVLAAHSVVRNEIFLHREEIVQRIRKLPGCEGLRSLNIRAG
ncbi:MAG TPA: DUF721 domain-containing protein [Opitutaceae bacterium]|nr:DUF721 domain-containing protein [Opitutaceae bacterium]